MKRSLLPVVLLIIISGNFAAIAEQKQAHPHDHDTNPQQIRLNQGEKWEIDESLNIGMTLIKQEVIKNLDDIHNDLFSNQQYAQLAIELDKQLAFLFKNCQLPPQADAQLHILLAQIGRGVGVIKHDNNKKQGAVVVIQALKDYPNYFDDPAWQDIEH